MFEMPKQNPEGGDGLHFFQPDWIMKPTTLLLIFGFVIWVYVKSQADKGMGSIPGGMNYVVGPMGSGKSMFGVREIIKALASGKYVVTNVRLLPGWEKTAAKKKFPRRHREVGERQLRGLYIYEPSLQKAMRYRFPCAKCGKDVKECGHVGPFQEGRALVVWDETHNDLNNRDWDASSIPDKEMRAREKKLKANMIRWGTQLRKLGAIGYLLSQHHENTDAQFRRICNHIIWLQNQRNQGGFGAILPRRFAMFLVYWYPSHLADNKGQTHPVRFERYLLPWERTLYDSWETYHGIDDEDEEETTPILLPAGGRVADASAPGPAIAASA